MKRAIYVFAAAMMVFASSCSKDEQPVRIDEVKMVSATINAESTEGQTKTTASKEGDVYKIKWVKDDQLSVFNSEDTEMSLFISNSTGASAKFTGEIPEESEIVAAIYPYNAKASVSDDKKTVYTNVPTEQTGEFNNVVLAGWPKEAEEVNANADVYDFKYQFEAVCGIVKFSFDPSRIAEDKTITSISLTADQPLCGDAKISYPIEGKPVLNPNPNATGTNVYNTITIEKKDGFTAGDYYFATFPINANGDDGLNIVIRFETSTGDAAYKQATLKAVEKDGSKHILAANIVKNIGNVKVEEYDEINGLFSVASGKKVYFSPGNLQYQASGNNGNGLWRFALNQWDVQGDLGNATFPTTDEYGNYIDEGERAIQDEWIDLFPWGHSGWQKGQCPTLIRTENHNVNYFCWSKLSNGLTGANAEGDWGVFCNIVNGNKTDLAGTWRLLSWAELNYLLTSRKSLTTVSDGKGHSVQASYMRCGVKTGIDTEGNDVVRYGMLLFPDVFVWPSKGVNVPTLTGWPYIPINWAGADNSTCPVFTLTEISSLLKAGCALLPFAGYQAHFNGNEYGGNILVQSVNIQGHYFLSDRNNYYAIWDANNISSNTLGGADKSCAVRLVKNGTGF